jgi:ABC-type uncharacterized transport system, permease component
MNDKSLSFGSRCKEVLKKDWVQTIITSLLCAIVGIFVGFMLLLIINPANAFEGILNTIGNFFTFSLPKLQLKYFGQTLAKTAPLILTGLSILFAYKTGLFNIGASGQYTIGVLVTSYCALQWNLPWWLCLIIVAFAGAFWGGLAGLLKAFFNVNEVISGIMLNWIALYLTNGVLQLSSKVWDSVLSKTYIVKSSSASFLPTLGLENLFGGNTVVGVGMILVLIIAAIIYILLNKTVFGYEIRATGLNKNAAEYAGMKVKKNIIITMMISGALAGLAAPLMLLNGYTQWELSAAVPTMGFNGISAAFLGGLSPIGVIFSAYFIMHITDGGSTLTDLGYSPQTAQVITSFIIYLCAFVAFAKGYISHKLNYREIVNGEVVGKRETTKEKKKGNNSSKEDK